MRYLVQVDFSFTSSSESIKSVIAPINVLIATRKNFIHLTSTAGYCFQLLAAIPFLWSPFLGISMVFMLLYVWSREFPNAQVNIYGLVALKVFLTGSFYSAVASLRL